MTKSKKKPITIEDLQSLAKLMDEQPIPKALPMVFSKVFKEEGEKYFGKGRKDIKWV